MQKTNLKDSSFTWLHFFIYHPTDFTKGREQRNMQQYLNFTSAQLSRKNLIFENTNFK